MYRNLPAVKKIFVISFLLIANVILLAHAVVPHHEHDNMLICFFDSHCEDCTDTHDDTDCNTPAHHENNCSSGKCCTIDSIFDPTDNKVKTVCHAFTKCDCTQTHYILISGTLDLQDFVDDTLHLFLYEPYIVSFHIDCFSQLHGLRAPPAC